MEQMVLSLVSPQPYGLDYFVAHSGVSRAVAVLDESITSVKRDGAFRLVVLYGASGIGKTHLLRGFEQRALELGVTAGQLALWDEVDEATFLDQDRVRLFIDQYERFNRQGGLLLLAMKAHPSNAIHNPHILSRLKNGQIIECRFPREEELQPILHSLCERNNLRLSERSLRYLQRRLPVTPLSFANIFAKVSAFSLARGVPARLKILRELVH